MLNSIRPLYLFRILSVRLIANSPNILGSMSTIAAQNPVNEITKFSVSYVTTPNDTIAKFLARGLVERKLAACVNIIPAITSIYSWKNKTEEDQEVLMIIKSRTSRLPELTKYVRDNHPYEVCEVISTAITQGNPAYLQWLEDSAPESGSAITKTEM